MAAAKAPELRVRIASGTWAGTSPWARVEPRSTLCVVTDPNAPPPLPPEAFHTPDKKAEFMEAVWDLIRERQPRFWEAFQEDTRAYLLGRGEDRELDSRRAVVREALRLCLHTDAFLALALYRVRTRLVVRRVPVLPQLIHRVCMALCQLDIGEPVMIQPGVYIPHGQVVIDGAVQIGKGTILAPWITIGLIEGSMNSPTIGQYTFVGTGARILGDVTIGPRAKIGANAVVLHDVPAGTSVVGAPARPVQKKAGNAAERFKRAMMEKRAEAAAAQARGKGDVPDKK
jgi:serine O-acetyltransferase